MDVVQQAGQVMGAIKRLFNALNIQRIIDVLNTPSKYDDDWYGWATNQLSHVVVGFSLCVFALFLYDKMTPDYPPEWHAVAFVVGAYSAYEVGIQGWYGLDTITDIKFVMIGASVPIWLDFNETLNLQQVMPMLSGMRTLDAMVIVAALLWAEIFKGVLKRLTK